MLIQAQSPGSLYLTIPSLPSPGSSPLPWLVPNKNEHVLHPAPWNYCENFAPSEMLRSPSAKHFWSVLLEIISHSLIFYPPSFYRWIHVVSLLFSGHSPRRLSWSQTLLIPQTCHLAGIKGSSWPSYTNLLMAYERVGWGAWLWVMKEVQKCECQLFGPLCTYEGPNWAISFKISSRPICVSVVNTERHRHSNLSPCPHFLWKCISLRPKYFIYCLLNPREYLALV